MSGWVHWLMFEMPWFAMVIVATHLTVSCGQTVLHQWLGHNPSGGWFFRNHISFHHTFYARGHLVSSIYRGADGRATPFFLPPRCLEWVVTTQSGLPQVFLCSVGRRFSVPA